MGPFVDCTEDSTLVCGKTKLVGAIVQWRQHQPAEWHAKQNPGNVYYLGQLPQPSGNAFHAQLWTCQH